MQRLNLRQNSLIIITEDGSLRSDEAHQEGVRRRLLYIHEEMKIYCNRTIVSIDTSIEMYFKN